MLSSRRQPVFFWEMLLQESFVWWWGRAEPSQRPGGDAGGTFPPCTGIYPCSSPVAHGESRAP